MIDISFHMAATYILINIYLKPRLHLQFLLRFSSSDGYERVDKLRVHDNKYSGHS